jgi:hypothetical protein
MNQRRLPTTFFVALLLGGCASDDAAQEEVELHLPTQAESDAAADKRIDHQNADAELQKLEAEIAGEEKP